MHKPTMKESKILTRGNSVSGKCYKTITSTTTSTYGVGFVIRDYTKGTAYGTCGESNPEQVAMVPGNVWMYEVLIRTLLLLYAYARA